MLRKRAAVAVLILSTVACGSSTEPGGSGEGLRVDEVAEQGSYVIIGGPHGWVVGDSGVDTRWDEDLRAIYLGADENREPLGTLTITMGEPFQLAASGTWGARVEAAVLSLTRVRVGTSVELDARAYRGIPIDAATSSDFGAVLGGIQIGQNFFRAEFNMPMERIFVPVGETPDTIVVVGQFTALD